MGIPKGLAPGLENPPDGVLVIGFEDKLAFPNGVMLELPNGLLEADVGCAPNVAPLLVPVPNPPVAPKLPEDPKPPVDPDVAPKPPVNPDVAPKPPVDPDVAPKPPVDPDDPKPPEDPRNKKDIFTALFFTIYQVQRNIEKMKY